jgi:fatty-acyl-CoA synthase
MTNGIRLIDWRTHLAERIFLESDSGQYTYRLAADYIASAAQCLSFYVPEEQEIVPILLQNSPELVLLLLATMASGKTPYLIQPTCKPGEFRAKLSGLSIQAALCSEASYDLVFDAGLKPITLAKIQPLIAKDIGNHFLDQIPGEAKLMCATSGTTTTPKRVVLQLERMLGNASAHAESLGLSSDDRILSCLPFYHVFTLSAHIFSVISLGATFVIGCDPSPQTVSRMIETYAVTYTSFVPALMDVIIRNYDYELFDSGSLKKISVGSAPASVQQIKRYKNFFVNQTIYITYGLSEAGPRVSTLNVNQTDEALWDTVGLPLENTEVRIANPDEQGIGELQVRSPWQMLGYYGESNAEVWDDGWLKTGDLATLTGDRYIRLRGRRKDLIISGGVNISPAEIETALNKIPWIIEATVLPVPDRKRGEVPHAFVVREGGGTEQEVLSILRSQLDQIKVPKKVHFVSQIPKNATGKADRFALQKFYLERYFRSVEELA